jgi:hypothetical protein
MKKNYVAPHLEIIEIEIESLLMITSPKYDNASASSSDGEVQVTYDGIGKIGIGDGGFLGGK